jgi:hypothetical protein
MVDCPPSVGTLRDCSKYIKNTASVYYIASISIIHLVVGVRQPTKLPDPLSRASRALQVFNLADCRIFAGRSLRCPRSLLEYHSITSARAARLANSFAFARPIHSGGHRSKKLNTLNMSGEIFSIAGSTEALDSMHLAITFGEIDSSEAVCSPINARIASTRDISADVYDESHLWAFLPRKLLSSQKIAECSNLHTTCWTVIPKKTSLSAEGSWA